MDGQTFAPQRKRRRHELYDTKGIETFFRFLHGKKKEHCAAMMTASQFGQIFVYECCNWRRHSEAKARSFFNLILHLKMNGIHPNPVIRLVTQRHASTG